MGGNLRLNKKIYDWFGRIFTLAYKHLWFTKSSLFVVLVKRKLDD